MPCHSDYPTENELHLEQTRREQIDGYRKELDKLTRMLCESMGILDRLADHGVINYYSVGEELEEWWKKHKEFDASEGR